MQTSTANITLQIAQTVPCTAAEGPGQRFAIWFQGCPLRCPECCNPQMLSFDGGTSWRLEELLDEIATAQRDEGIEGITLLGGEPVAHAASAAPLAEAVQRRGLSVMVFTGYELEAIQADASPEVAALLRNTDILVDGPYIRELPDRERRWIGSRSQRIPCLSGRYRADDSCWQSPDTLEIRLTAGELRVNGFPAQSAVGIWKRPRKLPNATES